MPHPVQCISVQILEKAVYHNLKFPFKLQLLFKALKISSQDTQNGLKPGSLFNGKIINGTQPARSEVLRAKLLKIQVLWDRVHCNAARCP
jgi:hypothetical protein